MRLPLRLRMYARPNSKKSKPCGEISIPGNTRGEQFETNPFKCPTGVLRIATRVATLLADVPSVVHSSDNSTITETSLGSVTAMFALVSMDDELRATDDIANARRKGPMKYSD